MNAIKGRRTGFKEFAAKEKLEIVLSAPVQGEAGGRGGGGIPPAEPSQFRSDIFKQTPQIDINKLMKSPEFITARHEFRERCRKNKKEGFEAQEGRATVSGDLIYAFEWATKQERRKGSKSESKIGEEEKGRMVIMKVPEDKSVNYATHTNIEIDESSKEITGYSSKYESGRKQLAIYDEGDVVEKESSLSQMLLSHKKNILMSVVPTAELGKKLSELSQKIRNLEAVDLENFTEEISKIIEDNKENFLASGLDVREVIGNLLASTMETEVVNMVRSLSMGAKRAQGYEIYNRDKDEVKEKVVDKDQLRQKLEKILSIVEADNFDIGMKNLNRYIRMNMKKLSEELK